MTMVNFCSAATVSVYPLNLEIYPSCKAGIHLLFFAAPSN